MNDLTLRVKRNEFRCSKLYHVGSLVLKLLAIALVAAIEIWIFKLSQGG